MQSGNSKFKSDEEIRVERNEKLDFSSSWMKKKAQYKPNSSKFLYTRRKKGNSHIINKGEEKLKEWKPKGTANLKAEAHSTSFSLKCKL